MSRLSLPSTSTLAIIALSCFVMVNLATCGQIYDANSGLPPMNPALDKLVDDKQQLEQRDNVQVRAKRQFWYHNERRSWRTEEIVEAILCVFIPPAAVLIHGGPDMLLHLIINIVLWILGWIPGMIHAFWYCFYKD